MRYVICLTLTFAGSAVRADDAPNFNRDVRPILADKCYHCHGPDEKHRKGDLRLDTAAGAAEAVRGAKPGESELVRRITSTEAGEQMPPRKSNFTKSLTAKEIATLKAWVAAGGKYTNHWAFDPPKRAAAPATKHATRNDIDKFVFSRLEKVGFAPSPEADKATLLRRVTLDLTGFPPTPEELDEFLADTTPTAYERVVDRLLKSRRYGERMAVAWLDLARYGDSSVYHADGPRNMWAWRDWVIRAFNENKPFDQFSIEQIAGDLLPNATQEQKVASGFNRNHATTDEGGVIPEEFRVDYVVDRVKTVSSTWLALSVECAQCHDHKYDPISQREYYQFYAYFNNTRDPGMQTRNGNQAPTVDVFDPEAEAKRETARSARGAAEKQIAELRTKAVAGKAFTDWLAKQKPPAGATAPTAELALYFPFDETDTATAFDYLGGTAVTITGKATEAKRPKGNGFTLPANTVYRVSRDPELDWNTPFTFATWVKLPANGGGFLLTKMDEAPTYRGFDLGFDGRKPGLHIINNWAANALKVYAKKPIAADTWQHVVITSDGTGKAAGIRIYVGGELQEVEVQNDTLSASAKTTAPVRLGSRTDGGGFNGSIDDLAIYRGAMTAEDVKQASSDPIERLFSVNTEKLTAAQKTVLAERFLRESDKTFRVALTALAKRFDEERKIETSRANVMVMEDNPAGQMRATYVLNRGQYDQPLKDLAVKPGVPAALGELPAGVPANRLGLAKWLVRPDHPLTSRVAVNRLWQGFFGEGLVRSTEDFGIQGESPSHPELLDWLAVDFVESGWDVKRAVKQIVTSATYRQASRIAPEVREKDPENRLFARGPRFRLQAEFVRDSALFVSGLYIEKVGGPSVRPYQPAGVWEEVAIDTNLSRFVQDKGDKLYRRSLYTYWKRSSPHPAMMAFDAPTREKCIGSRSRTNTPLQALVTLNDPQFVEAARAFAERIIRNGGASPEDRVRFAVRVALGRPATDKEVMLLAKLAAGQLTRFNDDPKKAEALLKVGESPRDVKIPVPEHAAWTTVANVILNLDEFLVKN